MLRDSHAIKNFIIFTERSFQFIYSQVRKTSSLTKPLVTLPSLIPSNTLGWKQFKLFDSKYVSLNLFFDISTDPFHYTNSTFWCIFSFYGARNTSISQRHLSLHKLWKRVKHRCFRSKGENKNYK